MARAAGSTQAAHKPRIRRQAPTRFLVESKSRPGTFHTVDTLHLHCDCEAGQHGLRCWHLVWSLQAERLYKDIDASHKAHGVTRMAAPAADAPQIARPSGMAALLEAFV